MGRWPMGCDLALPKLRFSQLLLHSPDFSPGGSRPDSPFTLGLSSLFLKTRDYPRVRHPQFPHTWARTWRAGAGRWYPVHTAHAPPGRAVCSGPRRGAGACAVAGATGTQHGGLRGAPGAGPGRARPLIRQPRHLRDGAGCTVRGYGGRSGALSEGWYGPGASREAGGHQGGCVLREYPR